MNIPIVQGVNVSEPETGYQQQGSGGGGVWNNNNNNNQPTQKQDLYTAVTASPNDSNNNPRQFQDVFWGLLFIAHLIAILIVIAIGLSNVDGGDITSGSYGNILFMVSATGLSAIALSTFALSFMMRNAKILVQVALIFSIGTSLAIGIVGFMIGSMMMGLIGIGSFAIGCCYAKLVWHRIPFAAINLKTALTAVKQNLGLAAVSYGFTALAFGWTIIWFLGLGSNLSNSQLIVVFLLFVSYYWVHQVLQNTIHVTTAGVIGTWWFVPDEASSCCSRALGDSFFRATTYSFGSICFGSLLVAIVQALRAIEYYTRDNDELNFLSCIVQCLLSCLQAILEEITRFAYVYVGLYGFSFLDAGRNVIQLFQQKGWTVIITDDLADNVLFMMSVGIGLATGVIGLVLASFQQDMFQDFGVENALGGGFLIGFLTGFLFASVLLSVVGSAVNTVIVCFAEAPAEFETNHPQLSAEMRDAWTNAWPGLFS